MNIPTPVVIVRPNTEAVEFISSFGVLFINSWLVMILAPVVTDQAFHPSYWKTVALIIVSGALFKSYDYPRLSRSLKRGE